MTNEKNLTPEMLEKAKSAPSAAALLTLAQENGITLTAEEAATYYTKLHPETGALSDEELDNVSGGGGCTWTVTKHDDCICGKKGRFVMVKANRDLYECACGRTWFAEPRNE